MVAVPVVTRRIIELKDSIRILSCILALPVAIVLINLTTYDIKVDRRVRKRLPSRRIIYDGMNVTGPSLSLENLLLNDKKFKLRKTSPLVR